MNAAQKKIHTAKRKAIEPLRRKVEIERQAKHDAITKRCRPAKAKQRGRVLAMADANTILLYGMIEEDSATKFKQLLSKADPKKPLLIKIDSAGGSMLPANSIYDAITAFPSRTTCRIESSALSAAAFVAMAFDRREIAANGFVMIHSPYVEHEASASERTLLAKLGANMCDAISKVTGQATAAVGRLLKKETWLNANECVEQGFADEVI